MEIRNIESFLSIVQHKTFTKAAEELGYAQSTITMQIQQLEEELNAKLFDRIGRSVYLTDFGENFLVLAREMYNLSLEMKYLNSEPTMIHGTLRIGTIESFLLSNMNEVLIKFSENYPNIILDIRTGSTMELYDELSKNNFDIVFGIENEISQNKFEKIKLKTIEMSFMTRYSKNLKKMTLKEMEDKLFVLTENESYYNQKLMQIFNEKNLKIKKFIHIQNISAILNIIKENDVVAFLPTYVATRYIKNKEISIIDADLEQLTVKVNGYVNKEKWKTPYLIYFIKLIEKIF